MIEVRELRKGAFGEVYNTVDRDSGCFIVVKKVGFPLRVNLTVSNEEVLLRREVKVLSSISYVRALIRWLWCYILTMRTEKYRRIPRLFRLGHRNRGHLHEP